MTPEEFRDAAHKAVDWVADYLTRVEDFPVLSQVQPGWVRSQLPEAPPEQGEPFEAILSDLNEVILPGITHWQSPNFYAFFPANASGPAVIGDLVRKTTILASVGRPLAARTSNRRSTQPDHDKGNPSTGPKSSECPAHVANEINYRVTIHADEPVD